MNPGIGLSDRRVPPPQRCGCPRAALRALRHCPPPAACRSRGGRPQTPVFKQPRGRIHMERAEAGKDARERPFLKIRGPSNLTWGRCRGREEANELFPKAEGPNPLGGAEAGKDANACFRKKTACSRRASWGLPKGWKRMQAKFSRSRRLPELSRPGRTEAGKRACQRRFSISRGQNRACSCYAEARKAAC